MSSVALVITEMEQQRESKFREGVWSGRSGFVRRRRRALLVSGGSMARRWIGEVLLAGGVAVGKRRMSPTASIPRSNPVAGEPLHAAPGG